jgi:hypothetical protein
MSRVVRARSFRWTPLVVLAVVVVGCAPYFTADPPGPGVPRINGLDILPHRAMAGCPLTVQFNFEDLHGDVTRVAAHWTLEQSNRHVDSGYATVGVQPGMLAGKTQGVVTATLNVSQPGRYWYQVQVEDSHGFRSNVLAAMVLIDLPLPWATPKCP